MKSYGSAVNCCYVTWRPQAWTSARRLSAIYYVSLQTYS